MHSRRACRPRRRPARCRVQCSCGMRRTGMRPSLPWNGPSKSRSRSTFLKIRQHVVPAPARGAARLPFVVVGRRAAVGHLAVDRGPAAQHARLLVFAQRRAFRLGIVVADDLGRDLEFGPVEARIEIGRARIAVADFGRLVAGRGVLAGLAEQDLVGALGGEPVRQDRAGRAAADDDDSRTLRRFPFCFCQGRLANAAGSRQSVACERRMVEIPPAPHPAIPEWATGGRPHRSELKIRPDFGMIRWP